MKTSIQTIAALFFVFATGCSPSRMAAVPGDAVQFKKTILTSDFVAEGVAVADVNKDGKPDILSGTYWWQAPDWTRHEVQPGRSFKTKEYSNTFLNFTMDVNYDGWQDFIRVDMPGNPATWYENPKGAPGFWKEHPLYHSVGNESPALHDIDGDGVMDMVCNDSKNKKMIWVSGPKSATDTAWTPHIISSDSVRGTHMYTHGLGFGDMNGDGREDVLMREGWWEAPADRTQENWTFHTANLGAECSQMYVMDLDSDGDMDVVTSSAHNYGMWWHEQVKNGNDITWKQHEIYKAISQTHGMALADVNRDGHMDLITGKRYYAHNGHDPGAEDASMLYWFEYKPGKTPQWIPHQIDNNSGVGLHLVTQDMNGDGRLDVVIGNKKGVFYFEQLK